MEHFLQGRECLAIEPVNMALIQPRLALYSAAIYAKTNALHNYVGCIDVTVLRITLSNDNDAEEVVYNGHKRAHGLKYQRV